MQEIEKMPEFKVQPLLEGALRRLEATTFGGLHGHLIEAARIEVAAVLAAQPKSSEKEQSAVEQTLRRTAKSLMVVRDISVESARLAIMSAADMLRVG